MSQRTSRIALLVLCSAVAGVAGILALDPLLFHGFAPACSDGYAEASRTAPCTPEWDAATPYLIVLGLALTGVGLCARSLTGGADRRTTAESRMGHNRRVQDGHLVDHSKRNRSVAIVGGSVLLVVAAWLWLSAPPGVHAPDFLSAREERLYWVAGFASWGFVAAVLGTASAMASRRKVAADRLAASGFWVVWIAFAGSAVLYAVANL